MEPTIKIALVGAGMFGGDVHLRAYADLQRFGIAGQLARLGLDQHARDFAAVKFELAAIATRSEASAKRAAENFSGITHPPPHSSGAASHASWRRSEAKAEPRTYFGDAPWLDIL